MEATSNQRRRSCQAATLGPNLVSADNPRRTTALSERTLVEVSFVLKCSLLVTP
jgi:hypothetical protein